MHRARVRRRSPVLSLLHPSLRLLARLKLRGLLRKQTRRLKGAKQIIFLVLGLLLAVTWVFALAAPSGRAGLDFSPQQLTTVIQLGCALLALLTVTSCLSHRGLYLPAAEIEVLLAAPVSRPDLVRYRILSGLGRVLLGGLVVGLVSSRHMPDRVFGMLGALTVMMISPVLGQGISLLAGSAENRIANRLSRFPLQAVTVGIGVVLMGFVLVLTLGARRGARLAELGLGINFAEVLDNPLLLVLLTPFRPWANMMMAADLATFLTWFVVCWGIWYVAFELVARIPVDFRELSLSTSSDVAQRLRRGRPRMVKAARGGSLWHLPWFFGRSPFGAIAWRKANSITRKARGTLLTGATIIGGLTLVATLFVSSSVVLGEPGSVEDVVVVPAAIAIIGTIYLCTGLRLDFREDLDQMPQIKSWPLAPWRVFLATLVPEIVLVTGFVLIGVALQVSFTGRWHPALLGLVVAQPFVVLIWTAIDNVVFLLSPIRYVPGQDGALNHVGRALILALLRIVALGLAALGFAAAVSVAFLLQAGLGFEERFMGPLALALAAVVLMFEVTGLVWAGGQAFRRFDVARDRG